MRTYSPNLARAIAQGDRTAEARFLAVMRYRVFRVLAARVPSESIAAELTDAALETAVEILRRTRRHHLPAEPLTLWVARRKYAAWARVRQAGPARDAGMAHLAAKPITPTPSPASVDAAMLERAGERFTAITEVKTTVTKSAVANSTVRTDRRSTNPCENLLT